MTTTDYAQLKAARELLTRIPLPLDVEAGETPGTPYTVTHDGTAEHGTATARTLLAAMARQLDDYILPRSASVDNPLTIVVGGSTGAGKSTLVNTLLGEPLTQSGAIRPTTRHPVLLHRAEDEAALSPERFLPTLPRTRTSGMNAGSQALPGLDPKIARALIPITTSALPQGIALIDAPDIDSVSEENRTLAKELLSAAPEQNVGANGEAKGNEAKGEVQSAEDIFSAAVAEQIRLWQGSVLEMIREEGADKRKRARFLSLGVNATAVMLMVAAFSLTGGITGIEAGIAGGSGVVGTKLLESIFGEDAVRRMATRARTDLLERMSGLLTEHAQPFTAVLEETDPQADAEDIHRAAEQVQAIAAEMSTQSQTTQRQAAAHTNGTVAR